MRKRCQETWQAGRLILALWKQGIDGNPLLSFGSAAQMFFLSSLIVYLYLYILYLFDQF